MSLLAKAFREKVSKLKDYGMKVETEANVGYPTGFLSYDFRNGKIVHGVDPQGNSAPYYSIGIPDGSMVMIIGRSGSGKTTFAVQSAGNIIRPFKTSCIFHDDIESGIIHERKSNLVKMHGHELHERYIHRNTGITAENFYERIKIIHDLKSNNREDYEYDTKTYDEMGNRIYKLEPTVYILDSLALLMPAKYTEEEDISGQMSATAAAKMNAMLFKRVIPMLKSSNIILLIINHITQKIDISMFAKSKAQVSYLKQQESVPGGFTPIYLSNIMIRFDDHSKLKKDDTFGIDGTMVDLTLIKSRNNKAGQVVTLVFDQDIGFDPELSLLVLLKQNKRINGSGAYLYIDDRSDIKFSQKQFKNKLRENPELQEILINTSIEILEGFLYNIDIESSNEDFDITSILLDKLAS